MPPIHNVRAPHQWAIIRQHIDFEGKVVLDLGCGAADILKCAAAAGAECYGLDRAVPGPQLMGGIKLINLDISALTAYYPPFKVDVVICFSVLPYLGNPARLLTWIRRSSETAFIECQYKGDGPGPDWAKNREDMAAALGRTFPYVERVGATLVEGRNKWRDIWECKG